MAIFIPLKIMPYQAITISKENFIISLSIFPLAVFFVLNLSYGTRGPHHRLPYSYVVSRIHYQQNAYGDFEFVYISSFVSSH